MQSAAIVLLAAATLAACSSNSALDSHAAQQRDATKGAVLPGLQATKTVKEFFPPTPTPGPTMTPRATISGLQLASSVDSSGAATNTISSAYSGQQIYAVAQLSHLYAGETVSALWYNSDGTLLSENDQKITADIDSATIALAWTVGAGAFGDCYVEIWVGTHFTGGKIDVGNFLNTKMNSIVFSVG